MTLGSMRRHGVRGLFVTCQHCLHERAVNVDDWPDEAPVRSFGPRMRCSSCGKLGATAVPNWVERADRLPGGAPLSRRTPTLSQMSRGRAAQPAAEVRANRARSRNSALPRLPAID
jgi:hypothetical protein